MKRLLFIALYIFQRRIYGFQKRETIRRALVNFLPKNRYTSPEEPSKQAQEIYEQGYSILPSMLNSQEIDEIVTYMSSKDMFQQYDPNRIAYTESKLPSGTNTASYFEKDILACPHVLELANSELFINIASQVLGCKPTLSSIKIWKSYGAKSAKDSQNFHRDVDDIGFIKIFVYLSDVDEEMGPHIFVAGSHRDPNLVKIRRYSDKEVNEKFESSKFISFTGPAGTIFAENTYGLHKGTVPSKSGRIILQFEYSVFPIGGYKYNNKITLPNNFDKYINRLFCQ